MKRSQAQIINDLVLGGVAVVFLLGLYFLRALPTWGLLAVVAAAGVFRIGLDNRRNSRARQELAAPADGLLLGEDRDHRPVILTDTQLAAHGLIVGASGAGKSTTLLRILTQEITRGRPVIVIDLKGSPAFGTALYKTAVAAGRPVAVWTPDGPAHWNPLQYGNATELKDKLISTERFTEPHYQRAAERYLQTAIQVLQESRPDRPVTLTAVAAMMDQERLVAQLGKVPPPMAKRVAQYLSGLTRDQQSAIFGLASRLAVINESENGKWLEPSGGIDVDLRRAITRGEVVIFSLNASTYGKLAANIAALIIQDLVTVAGHQLQQPAGGMAFVAIDEFSALEADNVLALLARGRESRMCVLLSTQELADLDRAARGFKDQVLGIIALLAAHRQNVPASAELIAKMIGTDTVVKTTHQTDRSTLGQILGQRDARLRTGLGTEREVEEFRIHPNVIKELRTGEAVLITKLPTSTARIVQVYPPVLSDQQQRGGSDARPA